MSQTEYVRASDLDMTVAEVRRRWPQAVEYVGLDGEPCWRRETLVDATPAADDAARGTTHDRYDRDQRLLPRRRPRAAAAYLGKGRIPIPLPSRPKAGLEGVGKAPPDARGPGPALPHQRRPERRAPAGGA